MPKLYPAQPVAPMTQVPGPQISNPLGGLPKMTNMGNEPQQGFLGNPQQPPKAPLQQLTNQPRPVNNGMRIGLPQTGPMRKLGFPIDLEKREKLAALMQSDPFCYGFLHHHLVNGVSAEKLADNISKSASMGEPLAAAWNRLLSKEAAGLPYLPNPAKPLGGTPSITGPTPPSLSKSVAPAPAKPPMGFAVQKPQPQMGFTAQTPQPRMDFMQQAPKSPVVSNEFSGTKPRNNEFAGTKPRNEPNYLGDSGGPVMDPRDPDYAKPRYSMSVSSRGAGGEFAGTKPRNEPALNTSKPQVAPSEFTGTKPRNTPLPAPNRSDFYIDAKPRGREVFDNELASADAKARTLRMEDAYNTYRSDPKYKSRLPQEYQGQFKKMDGMLPGMYQDHRSKLLEGLNKDPKMLSSMKDVGFAAPHWNAEDLIKARYPHLYEHDRLRSKIDQGPVVSPRSVAEAEKSNDLGPDPTNDVVNKSHHSVDSKAWPSLQKAYTPRYKLDQEGNFGVQFNPSAEVRERIGKLLADKSYPSGVLGLQSGSANALQSAAGGLNTGIKNTYKALGTADDPEVSSDMLAAISGGPRRTALQSAGLPVDKPIDQWTNDEVAQAHSIVGDNVPQYDPKFLEGGLGGLARLPALARMLGPVGRLFKGGRGLAGAANIAPKAMAATEAAPALAGAARTAPIYANIPKAMSSAAPATEAAAQPALSLGQKIMGRWATDPARSGMIGSRIMPNSNSALSGALRYTADRGAKSLAVAGVDQTLKQTGVYDKYPGAGRVRNSVATIGGLAHPAIRMGMGPAVAHDNFMARSQMEAEQATGKPWQELSPEEQASYRNRAHYLSAIAALPAGNTAALGISMMPSDVDVNQVLDAPGRAVRTLNRPDTLDLWNKADDVSKQEALGLKSPEEYSAARPQIEALIEQMKNEPRFSEGGTLNKKFVQALKGNFGDMTNQKQTELRDAYLRSFASKNQTNPEIAKSLEQAASPDATVGRPAMDRLMAALRKDPELGNAFMVANKHPWSRSSVPPAVPQPQAPQPAPADNFDTEMAGWTVDGPPPTPTAQSLLAQAPGVTSPNATLPPPMTEAAQPNAPAAPLNPKVKVIVEKMQSDAMAKVQAMAKTFRFNLSDPRQKEQFLQKPEVQQAGVAKLEGDPAAKTQQGGALGIWNSLDSNQKMMLIGGLSIAAIGLITSFMSSSNNESGSPGMLGPILGLGGLAAAGYGATGGQPGKLLTGDFWRGAGKDMGAGLNKLPFWNQKQSGFGDYLLQRVGNATTKPVLDFAKDFFSTKTTMSNGGTGVGAIPNPREMADSIGNGLGLTKTPGQYGPMPRYSRDGRLLPGPVTPASHDQRRELEDLAKNAPLNAAKYNPNNKPAAPLAPQPAPKVPGPIK